MLEEVVLDVAGRRLPHSDCTISPGAEQAVRTASFDVPWNGPGLPCQADEECTVTASGDLLLTGYVRDVNWAHDKDTRSYTVTVVSRTVDATEASIDHPTGYCENCDLKQIAAEFDTAGIGVDVDVEGLQKKALHQINPGDTLFETLEVEARANGALIYDTPQGRLKITDKPAGRHAGALRFRENILRANGSLSGRFNFSEVKVRGQASYGTKGTALHPEAEAKGTGNRKRTLIVYHEGEATSERLKKRSTSEAKRASGRDKAASVTVAGWRDEAGRLWEPNYLVQMVDDWGGLDQDMVISAVSFKQAATGGTQAVLTLKDPRALGGENPRGKSAAGWSAPDSEPSYREG